MNPTCEQIRLVLLDVLDPSEAGEKTRLTVFDHLRTCQACTAEFEALREGIAVLADVPVRPPSAVRARLLAHARAEDGGGKTAGGRIRARSLWLSLGAIAASIVAASLGVTALGDRSSPPVPSEGIDPFALAVGSSFPEFVATDVASGQPVSLSGLTGHVVLLNIWATWCGPCETEMPSMERLYRELGTQGLSIVAVSVDQESTSKVRQWVEERGLTFTVLHDREGRFERTFPSVGVPESFLIGRDGVLVAREFGPRIWDSPSNGAAVRALLEQDGP